MMINPKPYSSFTAESHMGDSYSTFVDITSSCPKIYSLEICIISQQWIIKSSLPRKPLTKLNICWYEFLLSLTYFSWEWKISNKSAVGNKIFSPQEASDEAEYSDLIQLQPLKWFLWPPIVEHLTCVFCQPCPALNAQNVSHPIMGTHWKYWE